MKAHNALQETNIKRGKSPEILEGIILRTFIVESPIPSILNKLIMKTLLPVKTLSSSHLFGLVVYMTHKKQQGLWVFHGISSKFQTGQLNLKTQKNPPSPGISSPEAGFTKFLDGLKTEDPSQKNPKFKKTGKLHDLKNHTNFPRSKV